MKTTTSQQLRIQTVIFHSLSIMWFIIAGIQYMDGRHIGPVLPAVLCAVIWGKLGDRTGDRLEREMQDEA